MIGEEVRRRREKLGLTGAQLAARAGMAPSAVSQIETGRRTPSSSSVIKLAAALNVEAGDLYPKSQAPLQLELEEQRGATEQTKEPKRFYNAYEALGHTLAFGWDGDLQKWEEKIPDGTSPDLFDFGRLLQWAMEIAGTNHVYKAIAQDSNGPQREQLEDTLRLMEDAERKALDKLKRAFEPAKTYDEFRKLWDANDMDAVLSSAEIR